MRAFSSLARNVTSLPLRLFSSFSLHFRCSSSDCWLQGRCIEAHFRYPHFTQDTFEPRTQTLMIQSQPGFLRHSLFFVNASIMQHLSHTGTQSFSPSSFLPSSSPGDLSGARLKSGGAQIVAKRMRSNGHLQNIIGLPASDTQNQSRTLLSG
jgi:hypothetical protein